jgi:hypothetical protein
VSVPLRQQLREALPVAMKARDRVTVGVLRSTLAAIDNAEAVAPADPHSLAIERSPIGAGATEVARQQLTPAAITQIVRDEADSRTAAADDYERAGRADRAAQLRDEARILAGYLSRA